MKYTQLIKYPLPPIKQKFNEYIKEMEKSKPTYHRLALYHAEVLDGVLAVTVFLYHYKNISEMHRKKQNGDIRAV